MPRLARIGGLFLVASVPLACSLGALQLFGNVLELPSLEKWLGGCLRTPARVTHWVGWSYLAAPLLLAVPLVQAVRGRRTYVLWLFGAASLPWLIAAVGAEFVVRERAAISTEFMTLRSLVLAVAAEVQAVRALGAFGTAVLASIVSIVLLVVAVRVRAPNTRLLLSPQWSVPAALACACMLAIAATLAAAQAVAAESTLGRLAVGELQEPSDLEWTARTWWVSRVAVDVSFALVAAAFIWSTARAVARGNWPVALPLYASLSLLGFADMRSAQRANDLVASISVPSLDHVWTGHPAVRGYRGPYVMFIGSVLTREGLVTADGTVVRWNDADSDSLIAQATSAAASTYVSGAGWGDRLIVALDGSISTMELTRFMRAARRSSIRVVTFAWRPTWSPFDSLGESLVAAHPALARATPRPALDVFLSADGDSVGSGSLVHVRRDDVRLMHATNPNSTYGFAISVDPDAPFSSVIETFQMLASDGRGVTWLEPITGHGD